MSVPEPPDAVVVAYVHDESSVRLNFHLSWEAMRVWDSAHHMRVGRGGVIRVPYQTGGVVRARRDIVRLFLSATKAPWLLMIDSDMGFGPDAVDRLVESADPVQRPVVGALTFAQFIGESDGMGGYRPAVWPVLLRWRDDDPGFHMMLDYPRDSMVRVDATGAAFLLVHRSVFERLRELNGGGEWSDWFRPLPSPGRPDDDLSEDFSFCFRLREAGIPLFVNTAVKTTHIKPNWLSEATFLASRGQRVEQPPTVEPATDKVAVIVPVLRRPQNAAPFMESLRSSDPNGLCTVYAVADTDDPDTIAAWEAAGATVLVDREADEPLRTFPRKVNFAYRAMVGVGSYGGKEPWLFLTGDDVKFHPGWLDQALAVAKQSAANVVGTNDLGNERVKRGEHATHMLIRRSYVDEVGASWDGPGVVCHEGYRHWAVDDEIVTAAKQRGTWASAKWAIVEHLHPWWTGRDADDTYRLGEERFQDDLALFAQRRDTAGLVAA